MVENIETTFGFEIEKKFKFIKFHRKTFLFLKPKFVISFNRNEWIVTSIDLRYTFSEQDERNKMKSEPKKRQKPRRTVNQGNKKFRSAP